jgi:hypothetical protein
MAELALWFARSWTGLYELERTLFVGNPTETEIVAVRGKSSGAYRVQKGKIGSFQWTPGVKALSIICLNALVRHTKSNHTYLPLLEGGRRSLAASLDYALNKQPEWLFNMFGADNQCNAYLRQIIFRSNSGIRRAGPVGISLNENLLAPNSISIYLENTPARDPEELDRLSQSIIQNEQSLASYTNVFVPDRLTSYTSALQDESIYLFEQQQFSGSYATKDRLISWQNNVLQENVFPAIVGRIVQAKHLFEELTYRSCDERTKIQFEEWLNNLTMERGGEYGQDQQFEREFVPGFHSWMKAHNESNAFNSNDLYQTFIWRDRLSKEIVATISIVPEDRGVKAKYKLKGVGFIGGSMVRWDLRSRGIGKYICARINQHLAEFSRRQGKPVSIHLFTRTFGEQAAISRLLDCIGFSPDPIGMIRTTAYGAAPLWSKQYAG